MATKKHYIEVADEAQLYEVCDYCERELEDGEEFTKRWFGRGEDQEYELMCPTCANRHYSDDHGGHGCDDEPCFADPGGRSALRAETASNPRNLPCPNCERKNVLTPADRARGYQCDACADAVERGGY